MSDSELLDQLHTEHKRIHAAFIARRIKEPPPVPAPPRQLPAQPIVVTGSPFDQRLRFDTFLVGEHNRLAFVEAQRASLALKPFYNPLYIYGAPGLGKTHLLQAIVHSAADLGRLAIYLTSERFLYDLVMRESFRDSLRDIHILAIDDFQFCEGKRFAARVGPLITSFLEGGHQLVIAADRPPHDLDGLDERVRSRLAGGLCIEIGALDEALRVRLLEARIATARQTYPSFEVPAEVVARVANMIQTNALDLWGAVNRLLARFIASPEVPCSIEIAQMLLRNLVHDPPPKRVRIDDIQKLVARHSGISRDEMMAARRTANLVRPRMIAMYLAKVLTPRSLPEIGRRFGGRDHTTVLHAVRKISGLLETDTALASEIEALKGTLLE